MMKIKNIVIHTSASPFGCALLINEWHIERKFASIGYHYVIGNGYAYGDSKYDPYYNGSIEIGRPPWRPGAHVGNVNRNKNTIGICLIGDPERKSRIPRLKDGAIFTVLQLQKLRGVLKFLLHEHNLGHDDVVGHYELDAAKPNCPGIDMDKARLYIAAVTEREANYLLSEIDGVERYLWPSGAA